MLKPPPTTRVQVLGEEIEYICAGNGSRTVVLVSGAGGPIESWYKVFEPISAFARVFAYNRAGLGKSSTPATAQVGSHLVASLRETLRVAGLVPPYILVGHSFGGLIVNLFARLHPGEVRAVVMLEATSPSDPSVLSAHETGLQRAIKRVLHWVAPMHPYAEVQHIEFTVGEIQAASPFPPVPLFVVTGSKPAMAWATATAALEARAANQRELVALSPHARHIFATKSGHFPQFTEPQLVVNAVKEAVNILPVQSSLRDAEHR